MTQKRLPGRCVAVYARPHWIFEGIIDTAMSDALRLPAEQRYAAELHALKSNDTGPIPPGWAMSPKSVETFIVGSDGHELSFDSGGTTQAMPISRKFFGDDILIQRCIVTLASDRGLLLIGEPGTAKSWLSEHLAAAISGTSLLTIQGSAGLTEDQIKYSWNYALLLADGPTEHALVPGPLHRAMTLGQVVRFEEITRAPHEIQDALLSAMSDKVLTIPELPGDSGTLLARRGFNVIGTANTRDRGVNEMSSALKRRFNFETVHPIADIHDELRLVQQQVEDLMSTSSTRHVELGEDVLELLVTTFHELRNGRTGEGVHVDRASSMMSTAEAVSVGFNAALYADFFGDQRLTPDHLVIHMAGAVVKENAADIQTLRNYFEVAVKPRANRRSGLWRKFYAARKYLNP